MRFCNEIGRGIVAKLKYIPIIRYMAVANMQYEIIGDNLQMVVTKLSS